MSRPQTRPSAGLVVCGCQAVSPAVCRWGEWLCSTHFLQRASASQSVLHVLQASVMAPHRPIPCVQAAPQELGLHAMYSPPYTRTDIYTRSAPLSSRVITESVAEHRRRRGHPLPPPSASLPQHASPRGTPGGLRLRGVQESLGEGAPSAPFSVVRDHQALPAAPAQLLPLLTARPWAVPTLRRISFPNAGARQDLAARGTATSHCIGPKQHNDGAHCVVPIISDDLPSADQSPALRGACAAWVVRADAAWAALWKPPPLSLFFLVCEPPKFTLKGGGHRVCQGLRQGRLRGLWYVDVKQ